MISINLFGFLNSEQIVPAKPDSQENANLSGEYGFDPLEQILPDLLAMRRI